MGGEDKKSRASEEVGEKGEYCTLSRQGKHNQKASDIP